MTSAAFAIYQRLEQQIGLIRLAVSREVQESQTDSVAALLRSCIVLAVATVDTYVHEQGVRLLGARAAVGAPEASQVASYLGLTPDKVTGNSAQGYVRLYLSYKTITTPKAIDKLFSSCGLEAEEIWLHAAMGLGTRPDRLRLQLQLQTDRRNQIAHEGDWDSAALDFRSLEEVHVTDCVTFISGLIKQFDLLLP